VEEEPLTSATAEPTDAPILDVRGLTVTFPSAPAPLRAVDGISFSMARGEALGLVGESGCGKSATALAIMRLIPEPGRVEAEAVDFEGEDLARLSESEMRLLRGSKLAMVFQEPMSSLNPALTIGEQVAEVPRAHARISRREAWRKAEALLTEVGLPDPARRMRQYPHEISGGMRQRAMIAAALACEPTLLIADEPTTALDVTVQAQILDLVMRVREVHGSSVLLITHNLGVVASSCDRVAVMYAGRLVETGPARELLTAPLHPYTRGLLASVPSLTSGLRDGRRLDSIPGTVPSPATMPPGCKFEPRCDLAEPACSEREPELSEAGAGRHVRCPVVLRA